MNHCRASLLFFITVVGCGGGGGGSASFAGVWRGNLVVASNSCKEPAVSAGTILHVNQDGSRVVLENTISGETFEGFITGEESFQVSKQAELQCVDTRTGEPVDSTTIAIFSYEFSQLEGDTAVVTFSEEFSNCSGNTGGFNSACRIEWGGALTRE